MNEPTPAIGDTSQAPLTCPACGKTQAIDEAFFTCDRVGDGPWCDRCFAVTPCGQGLHDEGCATMMIEAGEVGARQIVEAADGEAAADAPLPLGRVRWHCSEEDGGPDVGVELALGGGLTLYAGELADETVKSHGIKAASPSGWWLVLWGDKIEHIFGPVSDSYEAREAVDLMAGALRALEQLWRGASEEAVAYKAQADRLEDALNWFSGQHDLSLAYHAPVYCDDDEDGEEWRVYRERGPINDREWEMVGAGDDALKAILDARQTIAGEVAVHG